MKGGKHVHRSWSTGADPAHHPACDPALTATPWSVPSSGFPSLTIYDATVQNEWTPSGRSRLGERQARPCSVRGFHAEEEA
jgi:hypothetical protein